MAISTTIVASKTGKKAIDFRDSLNPASVENYANIHSQGGTKSDLYPSRIKAVLCDFSNGTGDASITVRSNLDVSLIARLYEFARQAITIDSSSKSMGIQNSAVQSMENAKEELSTLYKKAKAGASGNDLLNAIAAAGKSVAAAISGVEVRHGPKVNIDLKRVNMYRKDESQNLAPVTKTLIARNGIRPNGDIATYPWIIKISEGVAEPKVSDIGGWTYVESTYKQQREAYMNFSDEDMFRMMHSIMTYISVWQNCCGLQLVNTGRSKLEKERAAHDAGKESANG